MKSVWKTRRNIQKGLICFLACLLVFAAPAAARADTAISVSGTGEVYIPADTAIIYLGISARDKDVLAAQEKANKAINDICSALSEAGIAREDINTDYISINAIYDYSEEQEILTSYTANSSLAIRTEDMDKVGFIIDIAFSAGANTLNGVNFSASDVTAAKEESLKKAVEDASAKAKILAEAAGLEITGMNSLSEGGTYSFDAGLMNNFEAKAETAADAAPTTVNPAKITVSSNVTIEFAAE